MFNKKTFTHSDKHRGYYSPASKATYSDIVKRKEPTMNDADLPAAAVVITKEQRFETCTEFDEEYGYMYVLWRPPLEGLELYRFLWSNGKYKPVTPLRIIRIGFSLL